MSRFAVPTAFAGMSNPNNGLNLVVQPTWLPGFAMPGGFVRTTFSADGLSATNVTTPVHAFVGVVERSFSNAGGATYVNTHGYGNAGSGVVGETRDWINSAGGPAIFSGLDARVAAYAAANYKGC